MFDKTFDFLYKSNFYDKHSKIVKKISRILNNFENNSRFKNSVKIRTFNQLIDLGNFGKVHFSI